ncbi:NAD(P)-binding protein [Xylariaceae sp. FL0255]|nr:NAD(P)-binding protein [Xylariaceae sp. FL0255]
MFDGHTTSEQVIEAFKPEIKGKTIVIIGAGYPSIGSQMATYLAQGSPSHIVLVSRTASKIEPVLKTIAETDSTIETTFVQLDTTDHSAIRSEAPKILAAAPKIDILVHSAGAMATKEYTLDKQGIEFQLSANHVGSFLLINLLMPALLAGGKARFVNLTSSGYRLSPFRFDDWNYSGGKEYEPWTAYGRAKTANILFTYGIGARLKNRGLEATVVHPGYNGDTKLGEHLTWDDYGQIDQIFLRNRGFEWAWEEPRFKTFSQISGYVIPATPLIAALDPELRDKSPAYLQNSQVHEVEAHATNPEYVDRLWKLSEELVGQKFDY